MASFPLSNCNPTPEEYARLKAACNKSEPLPEIKPLYPDEIDVSHDSLEYKRMLEACRGENRRRRNKQLPKKFQMSVDIDFDSPEYEEIRKQSRR